MENNGSFSIIHPLSATW
ncbi:unnamed protein product, partial [Rotaria sp. Silwood1]